MIEPGRPPASSSWRVRVSYVACILIVAPASFLLIVPVSAWGGFGRWLLALIVCLVFLPVTVMLHRRVFPGDRA